MFVLAGMKSDLPHPDVSEQIRALVNSYPVIAQFEVSAVTGQGIPEVLDFLATEGADRVPTVIQAPPKRKRVKCSRIKTSVPCPRAAPPIRCSKAFAPSDLVKSESEEC